MAHAPGPWLVKELETRTAIKSGKRTVAYVQVARDDYENANLIVAAPDMLAALKTLVMQRDAHFHTRDAWDAARAAILKAEGG